MLQNCSKVYQEDQLAVFGMSSIETPLVAAHEVFASVVECIERLLCLYLPL